MYIIYNFLENFTDPIKSTKTKSLIQNILCPIFLLLEYMCYKYFWKNIVIKEMLSSDEIVDFLDKNEFGYTGNYILKSDLLSYNEFYDRLDLNEAKQLIKKDFVTAISEIITKNISINIEDFINLTVTTEIKIINKNNNTFKEKIYTVKLQFSRYYFLQQIIKKFYAWIIIVLSLTILLYYCHKFLF